MGDTWNIGAAADGISLGLFASRVAAICDEMGAALQRASFSPNIRDRLDFSCAIFDAQGELCAQAAHIPVHLGSMAFAMRQLVSHVDWEEGDVLIVNDPFLGGTHLPDVTLVAPLIVDGQCVAYVANRAHHADIGSETPGSMPISTHLDEEGLLLAPQWYYRRGRPCAEVRAAITAATGDDSVTLADLEAQASANRLGLQRLAGLVERQGRRQFAQRLDELNRYAERLAGAALSEIPVGCYDFSDVLDDDGVGSRDIRIEVSIRVTDDGIEVDFAGTSDAVPGNLNTPLSVAAAGVFYAFRTLMPAHTPACSGAFRRIRVLAPAGCLLNAQRPAAVAAGNVETSTRVVDVVLGALAGALPARIPAASQGSMNNLAMGAHGPVAWDYYETMGGGMGAGPLYDGLDAVQTHMTNTLNTPVEVLEQNYPLRVLRYAVRKNSGGAGAHRGGNGLIREFEFLAPATATLLTERRRHEAWGLAGGQAGACGENRLNGEPVPGKVRLDLESGDRLEIATPGGGGWGR